MLVDSHCHLDFPDFEDTLPEIVSRAEAVGVGRMVTICTRISKFAQVLEVAEAFDNIYCSVGTHPHNAHEEMDVSVEQIVELSQHPKVVAIGEAGLDYYYRQDYASAQAAGLRTHIAAARQTGLPLVIHSRDADEDMAAILAEETQNGSFPMVLHCFSSGRKLAETGIELGAYLSFSGILTFKNSTELRDIAADLPINRLLVETDAPYLAPTPYRGKRNEPSYVCETASVLADIRGVTDAEIRRITTENFHRLFSKVPQTESAPG